MKTVTASIIVPIYNTEKYLPQCVDSVLAQEFTDFELILVDDGSADHSWELCKKFEKKDARIRAIQQENLGAASARNRGIDSAVGRYLLFLDSDDFLGKDFLEAMIIAAQGADIGICKLIRYLPDGRAIATPPFDCDQTEWCWPVKNRYSIPCSRCIVHREIVEHGSLRFTDGRKTGEDQEFIIKCMLHSQSIVYVPMAEYYYRVNRASTMFRQDYCHFDAVEAMKSVELYAEDILSEQKFGMITNVFQNYKYPSLLEFAVLTLLTAGEKPKKLLTYMHMHGYDELLNTALKADDHWDSKFMRLWKINPSLCLYFFSVRKTIGRARRKVKFFSLSL